MAGVPLPIGHDGIEPIGRSGQVEGRHGVEYETKAAQKKLRVEDSRHLQAIRRFYMPALL